MLFVIGKSWLWQNHAFGGYSRCSGENGGGGRIGRNRSEKNRKSPRTLAILAPTNKAASVLRQHGVEATTLHRIIYTPALQPLIMSV